MAVYISDIGYVKVGDHWSSSLTELAFEASRNILKESPIKPEVLIVSNAFSEVTSSQSNLGPLVADSLGLDGVDSFKVESSGASGSAALHVAVEMLSSGHAESVLVVGVEKMRDLDPSKVLPAQGISESADYAQFFGISFSSLNALLSRLYMNEYDVSRHELSAFPVISHANSSTAQHAQFKKKFTVEEVSRSELVADPLRVLDCAPVGDGAAAVLLVNVKKVDKTKSNVEIIASESVSSGSSSFFRNHSYHFGSTAEATKKALKRSKLTIEDLDFFEIHDSYSILAALSVEAIGLADRGKSCTDAASGKFDLRGKFPISTFGGMKARGYPIGAAGIYQVCEAYMQLIGRAGPNQVVNARKGLIQALSGVDSSCFIHILSSRRSQA